MENPFQKGTPGRCVVSSWLGRGTARAQEPSRTCPWVVSAAWGPRWDRNLPKTKREEHGKSLWIYSLLVSPSGVFSVYLFFSRQHLAVTKEQDWHRTGIGHSLLQKNLQLSCLELSLWKGWELAILFHILAGPATLGSQDFPPEAQNMREDPSLSCSCGEEHSELLVFGLWKTHRDRDGRTCGLRQKKVAENHQKCAPWTWPSSV